MIKTILAFGYMFISLLFILPFGILSLIFYVIGLRKVMVKCIYFLQSGWARSIILMTGCKVTVAGKENIPKKDGFCFVSNHSGYLDIALLMGYCGHRVGFIAKQELIFMPFLNAWIFLIGGLYINRSSLSKASHTISKGAEKIKSGNNLIIFPEGHRSKGRGLLPFHPGSLKLATMAGAPIIPVALQGSYEAWEKTGHLTKVPLKITFCEPIETANLPAAERKLVLSDRIYAVIKEKLDS